MDEQAFLAKLGDVLQVNGGELNQDFALTADNWDSGAHLAAIALIDEEYGITVPARDLTACKSVGALLELVRQTLQQ